ncbi:hypothetical protein VTK73DRAFT_2686 [Phialemonium thermophilum]|uniref:Uncharacterized protein n=1 Tax=Phialemonium thermophilum TaxID=223376 RepID=A0ABR3VRK7_9PEZI
MNIERWCGIGKWDKKGWCLEWITQARDSSNQIENREALLITQASGREVHKDGVADQDGDPRQRGRAAGLLLSMKEARMREMLYRTGTIIRISSGRSMLQSSPPSLPAFPTLPASQIRSIPPPRPVHSPSPADGTPDKHDQARKRKKKGGNTGGAEEKHRQDARGQTKGATHGTARPEAQMRGNGDDVETRISG